MGFSSLLPCRISPTTNQILLQESGVTSASWYYKACHAQSLVINSVPECNSPVALRGMVCPRELSWATPCVAASASILSGQAACGGLKLHQLSHGSTAKIIARRVTSKCKFLIWLPQQSFWSAASRTSQGLPSVSPLDQTPCVVSQNPVLFGSKLSIWP